MQHVAGLGDTLLVPDDKEYRAFFDERDLFVKVLVRRGDDVGRETQAANHHPLADDHLSLDAFLKSLHGDARPVHVLRVRIKIFYSSHTLRLRDQSPLPDYTGTATEK